MATRSFRSSARRSPLQIRQLLPPRPPPSRTRASYSSLVLVPPSRTRARASYSYSFSFSYSYSSLVLVPRFRSSFSLLVIVIVIVIVTLTRTPLFVVRKNDGEDEYRCAEYEVRGTSGSTRTSRSTRTRTRTSRSTRREYEWEYEDEWEARVRVGVRGRVGVRVRLGGTSTIGSTSGSEEPPHNPLGGLAPSRHDGLGRLFWPGRQSPVRQIMVQRSLRPADPFAIILARDRQMGWSCRALPASKQFA